MKKIALLTLIALFLLAAPARAQISLLHEFAGGTGDGKWPYGSLLMSGSTLYGMTQFGGSEDSGTVFKMQADGSGFTVLHEFAWAAGDGNGPMGSLILSGSTLYGMTRFGGTSGSGFGTIFKIDTDGTGFALLHSFVGGADDGKYPIGTLTLYGTTLFGMTQLGGDNDQGTIFKMETDGTDFALLHDLSYSDGQQPNGSLILSGSTLYGVAPYGGSNSKGTVFKLQTDGSGYTKLHEFAGGGADGENSWGSLVLAGGYLYGLTSAGGDLNRGTIFKVKTDGTGFSLLHEFAGGTSDGRYPLGSLALSGSTLCGMTPNGGDVDFAGTVFKVQTDGSGYAVLHEFTGGAADGYQPYGDVIISGSTLYGMTSSGGDSNRGVVFSLPVTVDPSLTLTSPNGGESWTAGESHDITWTSGGTVGDVHIDYSTDGGDNWLSVAADEANDGSYSWTVPNAPSTSCLVRISESDGDPLDGSNSMFTILPPPTITVTSPNGGESWAAASTQEITWTSTGTVGNIDIIYSTNGGLNWNSIIVDTANDGSHLWTVPDTPSDNCYVQLLEHADSFPGDSSDTVFSIVTTPSSLTISGTITCGEAPLAGVVMSGLPGNPHTNPAGFYTASVDYDWSGTVTPALAGYAFNPASRGYANVTADQTSQDYAASMVPALRLTAPNGGEHWTLGETRSITWDAVAYTGTVRLVLFKGGVRFGNIATGVSASAGSYSWTVGQCIEGMAPEGSDYRLYLRSTDNTLVDPSDYLFALIGPAQLEVTSPNGGENWESGTQQNITWNANGFSGEVRLILFEKAKKIGQIATGIPASQGSYLWTVGVHQGGTAPAGALYSIRLRAADGSQEDYSDGPFAISEGDALVADHRQAETIQPPREWLERARALQRLLVFSARGNDPAPLGMRLLGSRDPNLVVSTADSPDGIGLPLQEATWRPEGVFDLREWPWVVEKAILDSNATVALVRADEPSLRSGQLNAEGYLAVLQELADRLPGVTWVCSTVSMDEPDELLERFNRRVREHVLQTQGALLDTSDIESWHAGEHALKDDAPVRHPVYRLEPGMAGEANLLRQGAATWWLLARMSGWEGSER